MDAFFHECSKRKQLSLASLIEGFYPVTKWLRRGSAVESLPGMRAILVLLLSLWSAGAAAQTAPPTPLMYKCMDAQRRVTYSNITCEKQGLQDAGPVADRTTSMPFTEPPKAAPSKPAATPPLPSETPKAPGEKLTK